MSMHAMQLNACTGLRSHLQLAAFPKTHIIYFTARFSNETKNMSKMSQRKVLASVGFIWSHIAPSVYQRHRSQHPKASFDPPYVNRRAGCKTSVLAHQFISFGCTRTISTAYTTSHGCLQRVGAVALSGFSIITKGEVLRWPNLCFIGLLLGMFNDMLSHGAIWRRLHVESQQLIV